MHILPLILEDSYDQLWLSWSFHNGSEGLDPSVRGADAQETGMAAHSSILAQKIPWTGGPGGATVHGVAESDTTEHAGTNEHLR